LASLAGFEPA